MIRTRTRTRVLAVLALLAAPAYAAAEIVARFA